jgi:hypothetical protein
LIHWWSMWIHTWIICWQNKITENIKQYSNVPFIDYFGAY